jgi:8-oxo-dGTP pyrophosphatase MutT (NUDIX family)
MIDTSPRDSFVERWSHIAVADVLTALAAPRPGRAAQARMIPRPRPGDIPPPPPEHPLREAGVLILLYQNKGELYFVLTRRTETVATHKGQISLPGGAREIGETLPETAVREACEELGILPEQIQILGESLTPLYIPASDYWVTAFVGFYAGTTLFEVEPEEVVEVILTPLATILDDATIHEEEWELRERRAMVPFFLIQGHKVWGATAMMLSEFAELLKQHLRSAYQIEMSEENDG